jgi:DUF2934 family protein
MAKRPSSNRSSAEDSGQAAPARPRARRARAAATTPPAPVPDTIAANPGVDRSEDMSQPAIGASFASEAGDDAPLEAMTSTSMGSEPSDQDIRLRAYHRYLERGGSQGSDFEDWLEAERELKSR